MSTETGQEVLGVGVPTELLRRLDSWRERQVVQPARNAVIREAIEKFLEEHEDVA